MKLEQRTLSSTGCLLLATVTGLLLLANCTSNQPRTSAAGIPEPVVAPTGSISSRVHVRINTYRVASGRRALERHSGLDQLAKQHSEAMRKQFLRNGEMIVDHDGFRARSQEACERFGISFLGENVFCAYGVTGDPSKKAVEGWIRSKGHHRNIKAKWAVTGIGVVEDGNGRVWATQIFGNAPSANAQWDFSALGDPRHNW